MRSYSTVKIAHTNINKRRLVIASVLENFNHYSFSLNFTFCQEKYAAIFASQLYTILAICKY